MSIKIATAPCSWGVWYADGTPSKTPWQVFLDQAQNAGYKALELGPDGYLPTDLNILKDELAKRNLEVCAGTVCYGFDQYNSFADFKHKIDDLCKRLVELNAKYLVTMDGSNVGDLSENKIGYMAKDYEKYFKMFKDLGEYTLKNYDIEVVFHPHAVSMIETEKEIEDMLEYTGLNLAFDTGHHACVNGLPQQNERSTIEFMKKHREKIKYLHFKNVNMAVHEKVINEKLGINWGFDNDLMCDLEDGTIDFLEIKNFLDEINFNGIAVIEQDMPNADTEYANAAAKRNLEYLAKINMI